MRKDGTHCYVPAKSCAQITMLDHPSYEPLNYVISDMGSNDSTSCVPRRNSTAGASRPTTRPLWPVSPRASGRVPQNMTSRVRKLSMSARVSATSFKSLEELRQFYRSPHLRQSIYYRPKRAYLTKYLPLPSHEGRCGVLRLLWLLTGLS